MRNDILENVAEFVESALDDQEEYLTEGDGINDYSTCFYESYHAEQTNKVKAFLIANRLYISEARLDGLEERLISEPPKIKHIMSSVDQSDLNLYSIHLQEIYINIPYSAFSQNMTEKRIRKFATSNSLDCISHSDKDCVTFCRPSDVVLAYTFTLDEIKTMLDDIN